MSAPSNPTAANGSKHWMVITNRLCGRKAMAHSVSVHRCWTKPPNTSKTKRHVIATEHSSMNTNNSWMHTMWNMMNGMRLGIDFSAGFIFRFFRQGFTPNFAAFFSSAGVYTTCLQRCHPFGVPLFPQFRRYQIIQFLSRIQQHALVRRDGHGMAVQAAQGLRRASLAVALDGGVVVLEGGGHFERNNA